MLARMLQKASTAASPMRMMEAAVYLLQIGMSELSENRPDFVQLDESSVVITTGDGKQRTKEDLYPAAQAGAQLKQYVTVRSMHYE